MIETHKVDRYWERYHRDITTVDLYWERCDRDPQQLIPTGNVDHRDTQQLIVYWERCDRDHNS